MALERPKIEKPEGDIPFELGIEDLTVGEGDEATKGKKVSVHYVGDGLRRARSRWCNRAARAARVCGRPAVRGLMDEATVRAMILQNFELSQSDPVRAHEMYADDAVLEFPQSGERFEGVENFREWRSNYPASTDFEIREIRGRDDLWVVEVTVSYDQGPRGYGVSVHELRGGKVVRETIYFGEGWEPPVWRAQWRAAP